MKNHVLNDTKLHGLEWTHVMVNDTKLLGLEWTHVMVKGI